MHSFFRNRFAVAAIAFFATSLLWPVAGQAQITTVPTGLAPGAHYRLAFETTATTSSFSGNIADYNAFVNTVASGVPSLASLGPWSAIASTGSVAARDNTSTNPAVDAVGAPIYNLDNQLVAATNTALWSVSNSSPLANPLDVTETGAVLPAFVWTGTYNDGSSYTLADFPFNTGALGAQFAEIGSSQNATVSWVAYSNGRQDSTYSLYAISGVLTVPTVPEPATLSLALIAGVGAIVVLRRRVAQR